MQLAGTAEQAATFELAYLREFFLERFLGTERVLRSAQSRIVIVLSQLFWEMSWS